MKNSMLDYSKVILQKVSFDPALFEKELRKAIAYLTGHELEELENWVLNTFGKKYQYAFIHSK